MNPALYLKLWEIKKRLFNKNDWKLIEKLKQQQYYDIKLLEEIQWLKLKKLITYAYENVEYYHNLFKKIDIHPSEIKSIYDFKKIPILKKEAVRNNFEKIIAKNISSTRLKKSFTGGSTGIPLAVYHDRLSNRILYANSIRYFEWLDIYPGDKIAQIWGLNRANSKDIYYKQNLFRRYFSNKIILDAFDLSYDKMREFFNILTKFKPKTIISYVTAMYEFAKFVNENRLYGVYPEAIILTAERMEPYQKRFIENVFKSKVYDFYGSCEIYWLSAECKEREGLHIFSDLRYIEFLDKDNETVKENEQGKIIVTDLENFAFPLIRYENGDLASYKSNACSCGRKLPLMSKVAGRISDRILIPDGSIIHGEYFTHIFYEFYKEVEKFQVHQVSRKTINIKLVLKNKENKDKIIKKLNLKFNELLIKGISINYYIVDDISREKSGKFRFVKSDLI